MKKLILTSALYFLILLSFTVSGQSKAKMDSIPPSWYGCYHEKGKLDNPVLIILKKTIACKGESYYYREISKTPDGYRIKAISQSDSLKLDLKMSDPAHLQVSGYPLGDSDLWESWRTIGAKPITIGELPAVIKRKWYQKVSENGYWPFFFEEKGIAAMGISPNPADEILVLDNQYRILVNTGQELNYFFLKNPDRNHIDIATGTGEFKTYTTNTEVPAKRPDNLNLLPEGFWSPWFSTDSAENLVATTGRENWTVNGVAYDLAHFRQSNDTLYFKLLKENMVVSVTITSLDQKYLKWHWEKDPPVILKSNQELPNGFVRPYNELPGRFFGYWYLNDGTNQLVLSLEADALKINGKTIKKFLLYENLGIYHIEFGSKKGPGHLVIEPLNYEYLLVKLNGQSPMLLKHGRDLPDLLSLTKSEIPESFIGNWFDPDKQNSYEYTMSRDFFIYRGEFYDLSDIMRGASHLTFTAKNKDNAYPVTLSHSNVGNLFSFGGSNPIVTVSVRNPAVPSHNGSTVYPEFQYIKGGKFNLKGYVLNHEKFPAFTTIMFYWHPVVGSSQVQKSITIDPDGKFQFELDMDHACELHGRMGKGFISLFASPGHDNTVILNAAEFNDRSSGGPSMAIAGPWADEIYVFYDYFQDFLKSQQNSSDMEHVRDDDSTAYKNYRFKNYQEQLGGLDRFCSSRSYSPFFRKWAETRITYSYYDDLMRYRWLKNSYNQKQTPYNIPVSPEWLEWDSYLPIDRNLVFNLSVATLMHEHQMYNSTRTMMDFYPKFPYLSLPKDANGKDVSKSEYYRAYCTLADKTYSPFMRDVLTALFVESAFSREGLEIMEPVVNEFLAKAETPWATDFLNDSWQTYLRHGKAEIPNPKVVATADTSKMTTWEKLIYPHKGKVIYVDFWATWCGPCVGQFPYSKMLHEALEGKDVVFLYLCGGGSKRPAWSAMVEKYGLKGDHRLLNDKEWGDVCNQFKVSGIPHYLLVDPAGKVIDKAADRPQGSDGYNKELYNKILSLKGK